MLGFDLACPVRRSSGMQYLIVGQCSPSTRFATVKLSSTKSRYVLQCSCRTPWGSVCSVSDGLLMIRIPCLRSSGVGNHLEKGMYTQKPYQAGQHAARPFGSNTNSLIGSLLLQYTNLDSFRPSTAPRIQYTSTTWAATSSSSES